MKTIATILCATLFLFSCKKETKIAYSELKKGTFFIEGDKDVTIVRNDSLQLEKYHSTAQIDSFAIVWKNDSTYVLTMLRPKTAIDTDSITYKIKTLDKNGYTFESNIENSNYIQKGRIFKK